MNCIRLLRFSQNQAHNQFRILSARISSHHLKYMETQDRWRERDKIPKQWQLIYKAPMDKLLNIVTTYLTFTTVTTGFGGIYYTAFVFDIANKDNPVLLGDDLVIANSGLECLTYVGAFILFHAAVKVLLSKYVIRLYQDGDEFLAIFRGHTYNSIKKHKFHLNDFKKLKPTLVVTWGDARFDIGNKHAILLENYFKTPEHFNYLLYKRGIHNPND